MTLAFLFWFLMVLALLFGGLGFLKAQPGSRLANVSSISLTWILFALLGWAVFGPLIK